MFKNSHRIVIHKNYLCPFGAAPSAFACKGHWPNSVVAATNLLALPTPAGSLNVTDFPLHVESPSAIMAVCRVSLGLPPVASRSPPYIDIKLAFSDASLIIFLEKMRNCANKG